MIIPAVLLCAVSGFDPGVNVVASTPDAAVRQLAVLQSKDDAEPILPPRVFEGLPIPGEGVEFRASPYGRGRRDGKLAVRVVATHGHRTVARRVFVFAWRTRTAVVVPTVDIEAGTVVTRDLLMLKEIETTTGRNSYVMAPEQVIGRVAKAPLFRRRPILISDVVLPQAIARGDKIVVRAHYGGMTVRMTATAMANGAVGDTIRVKNDRSKKDIAVQVTDLGEAEVQQ